MFLVIRMFIRSCLVEMVQEEKICGPDRLSSEPKCHLVPMVTRRETCGIQILTTVVSYNGCEYLILVHRRLTSNFCPVVLRDPVRRRHEFTFKPGVMRGCGPNPHWHSTCIAIVIFFGLHPPPSIKEPVTNQLSDEILLLRTCWGRLNPEPRWLGNSESESY